MRAGRLDRRVTVQTFTEQRGLAGGVVKQWGDWRTLWMGKRDVSARERATAAQTIAEIDTVFTAHFDPALLDIRPDTHRLIYRGRVYDVQGLSEIGRRDGVEIMTKARGEARYGE